MKKFFTILIAMIMVLAMSTTAMAEEIVHAGTLPASSEQEVSITITALNNGEEGGNEDARLPSEYHVRVKWDVANGVYNATATDSSEEGGFQNYSWDCVTLNYIVNPYTPSEGGSDIREGNWANKPKVAFEVTNASTPDLKIYATAALKGDDAWASLLNATSIADQNANVIGKQEIAPVLKANMGTGVDSYENGVTNGDAHNDYDYEYTLNWNYDALNALALANYKAGTGTQTLTNTFVVTITAK